MARDIEMDRRLQNWARWRVGMSYGGLGYASVCYEDVVDKSRNDAQAKIPTLSVEAEETDRANQINITVNVENNGQATTTSSGDSSNSFANNLAIGIKSVVQEEIAKSFQQGGFGWKAAQGR